MTYSCLLVLLALTIAGSDARAVNITNSWTLPEEGFPVFYRYFRDKISWYEADAVCQFHHANLVTVDTTAQYDAARAYLKELDIMTNVWIGLIKSNEDGDFTWTDYKPLSGEGYWASAPVERRAPLCAALDPSHDYRWSALSCGGPQVASFICELPVPTWATNENGGCLVKSLPSLTVQFLPELGAVQLASDCGLDGTKKVTCKPNEEHKDILKELSCTITDEDFSDNGVSQETTANGWTTVSGDGRTRRDTPKPASEDTTTAMPQTTTPIPVKLETTNIPTTEKEVKTNPSIIPVEVIIEPKREEELKKSEEPKKKPLPSVKLIKDTNKYVKIIPKVETTTVQIEETTVKATLSPIKGEYQPEMPKHSEIFTQATDHFIPPLVMAKSKLGSDMTVVSPESKHVHKPIQHATKPIKTVAVEVTTVQPVIKTEKPEIATTEKQIESTTIKTTPQVVTTSPIPSTTEKVVPEKISTVIPMIITNEPVSTTTSLNIPDKSINMITTEVIAKEPKVKKPGKGKKYIKELEDKKKYTKEMMTTTPLPQTESPNKVISIAIPDNSNKENSFTTLDITTKVPQTNPTTESNKPTQEPNKTEEKKLIDPHILELNTNGETNKESESVNSPEKVVSTTQNILITKTTTDIDVKPVPTSSSDESKESVEFVEESPADHSSEPVPKPNRSRLLTHTAQHRSFYPYFFNRVLG